MGSLKEGVWPPRKASQKLQGFAKTGFLALNIYVEMSEFQSLEVK